MEYDTLSQIISRNMEIDIFQTLQMLYPTHFQEVFQNYLLAESIYLCYPVTQQVQSWADVRTKAFLVSINIFYPLDCAAYSHSKRHNCD